MPPESSSSAADRMNDSGAELLLCYASSNAQMRKRNILIETPQLRVVNEKYIFLKSFNSLKKY